jgi:alkanesulfonate monooxygenase SsuD/methylene tetrahydromethanopterin reductase-like flavin-dependent oxidoreductase (luciferase family)
VNLEFGVFLTPTSDQPETVVELAVLADQVGLDLVTFQDHPYQPKLLDAWTLLSYVAGRTQRVRLAPNVLNLPLRPPAVVARAVAALDRLSGGRAELGIGAGGFWDAIEQMGGRRLTPGQSVDALEEAIDLIRALWTSEGRVTSDGAYYSLKRASPGPAPLHPPGLWIGAYKPRMLALTGRKGDGWLPSLPYLQEGDLARGNAAIDEAARAAGRDPSAIRRMLNLPLPDDPVAELTRLALEERVDTFIVMADDPRVIEALAEIAAAVRDRVAGAAAGPEVGAARTPAGALGITPTHDDGTRLTTQVPWDESTRPHHAPDPDTTYTPRGRAAGQHLIDVHDMLRRELAELRELVDQVRQGSMTAGAARSELNKMALRQNDWTLGAFCSRYCRVVATHHSLEDDSIFPHLARDPGLKPVIDRLTDEHHVIHDAIEAVDRALVAHLTHPDDFEPLQNALDLLTDALLSHLSYEERELVEPLARLGFYPGQL